MQPTVFRLYEYLNKTYFKIYLVNSFEQLQLEEVSKFVELDYYIASPK